MKSRFPDNNKSVHELYFSETNPEWTNEILFSKWEKIRSVRKVVTGAIELERKEKRIGSSLEANLTINLNEKMIKFTSGIDFSELCITSAARSEKIKSEEIVVKTVKAEGQKCPVCWKISKNPCERHSV